MRLNAAALLLKRSIALSIVLVLLFVKYVSDKYAGDPKALIEVPRSGALMTVTQVESAGIARVAGSSDSVLGISVVTSVA